MSHLPVNRPTTLNGIRSEIRLLRKQCSEGEKSMGEQAAYFGKNYPRILSDAVLPFDEEKKIRIGGILDALNDLISKLLPGYFEGRILPGIVLNVAEVLAIRLFGRVEKKEGDIPPP